MVILPQWPATIRKWKIIQDMLDKETFFDLGKVTKIFI